MTDATPQRPERQAPLHPIPDGAPGRFASRDPRTAAFVVALVAASPLQPRNAVMAFAARLYAWRAHGRRLGG